MSCIKSISCSSPDEYTKTFEIHLRKWEECNTIGLKIGFIAGSTINFLVVNTEFVIKKAAQIFHLNQAFRLFFKTFKGAAEKCFEGSKRVINLALKGIESALKTISNSQITQSVINWSVKNILNPVDRALKNLANAAFRTIKYLYNTCAIYSKKLSNFINTLKPYCVKSLKIIKDLSNRTIVPFYNRVLCPVGRFALEQLKKCKAPCLKAIKKLVNRTLVPLKNHILYPIAIKLKDIALKVINNVFKALGKLSKPLSDWIIKPLFNRVLSPIGTTLLEILDGLVGGLFGKNSDKPKNIEPKLPVKTETDVVNEDDNNTDDADFTKDLKIVTPE